MRKRAHGDLRQLSLENSRPRQGMHLKKLEGAYHEGHMFLVLMIYFLNTCAWVKMCKKDIQ